MASPASSISLLTSLTTALTATTASLPDASSIKPPSDGISLLETKNELLLSYLQNLAFSILLKTRVQSRRFRSHTSEEQDPEAHEEENDEERSLRNEVTRNLVELRIYLEKGVRPLESKLRYQIDKLVSAANEAEVVSKAATTGKPPVQNGTRKRASTADVGDEDQNDDSDDDDIDPTAGTLAARSTTTPIPISDLSHRPNPSAFARPSLQQTTRSTTATTSADFRPMNSGPYRPPRITPTALPTTTTTTTSSSQKASARQRTSHMLNDYIREEMDDAPLPQPSIGAGTGLRGREREKEEERRRYEETRLVRLPEEKKKKGKGRGSRGAGGIGDDGRGDLEGGFGGVEGVDFSGGGGGGKRRKRDTAGGGSGGGGGARVGAAWEKRVRQGVGRKRKGVK